MRKSVGRSFSCAFSVVKMSGCADGSSTSVRENHGPRRSQRRLAHQRCSVLGAHAMDFSRAEALLNRLQRQ